jgi:hypothetical protein
LRPRPGQNKIVTAFPATQPIHRCSMCALPSSRDKEYFSSLRLRSNRIRSKDIFIFSGK